MADFYGALLTTSFRVKDPEAYVADPIVQHFFHKAQASRFGVPLPKTTDDYTALGWDDQYPSTTDNVMEEAVRCQTCEEVIVTKNLPDPIPAMRDHLAGHNPNAKDMDGDQVDQCFEAWNGEADYNLTDAIERHIHPEDVCVVQVSGQEKLRYVGGELAFVTSKGTVWFPYGTTDWEAEHTVKSVYDMLTKFGDKAAELGL